ncbi:MAG: radical SAM family heme chaperone HemW [Ferruginibacter sp.]|nr:radical SAM family heme chaperone HemW [Cytophagales bacterium]
MHLYIHVPFCKQACYYCDFHFSTNLGQREAMVEAICREVSLQQAYLRMPEDDHRKKVSLQTVYFGGGTPSLLGEKDLDRIFDCIARHFQLGPGAEITLEANPDDITADQLRIWRQFPINRLSIGIQSFDPAHLRYLHRAHTADQAEDSVRLAQRAGFDNLSVDLIYAIPAADHAIWQADLEKAVGLEVPHLSSYCLTIEPRTVFGKWLSTGKIKAVDEEFAVRQFEMLVAQLGGHGYEQYEIANFARPGRYARHNRSYWQGQPYLGVGPSAHSFNGISRQYNVANNARYCQSIAEDRVPCTVEILSEQDRVNEYVMTNLRTQWGCDTREIQRLHGVDVLALHREYLENCRVRELLTVEESTIRLTVKGRLLADQIASDLFLVD